MATEERERKRHMNSPGSGHLTDATWGDCIEDVLREAHQAGEPDLHEQEITRRILDSGEKRSQGKTPERTVNDVLNNDSRGRFRRVSRGRYALTPTLMDTPSTPRHEDDNRRDGNGSGTDALSGEPTASRMFEEVHTDSILRQVPGKLEREEARSLWNKTNSEFASAGSRGVTTYLSARFAEIDRRLREELAVAKDAD